MKLQLAVAAAALSLGAMDASAATFTSRAGFLSPGYENCYVAANTAPFESGLALGYVSGQLCVGNFTVAVDTDAQTITLNGVAPFSVGNYQNASLSITGITEVAIAGVETIQFLPLFNTNFGAILPPTPALSFTADSILIAWDVAPDQLNFAAGGQAIFRYSVAAVPQPAALALFGAGAAMLVAARRRR